MHYQRSKKELYEKQYGKKIMVTPEATERKEDKNEDSEIDFSKLNSLNDS